MRRKHLELAELGRPAGQLGWGVRSEEERELVREAASRVLMGHGLMTIVRDWNTQGVPGASGGHWGAPTLRRVLLSSRIAGLREHGVDPSSKTLGDLSPAVWPAALGRQTWDQLRAVLLNPERNTNVRKATRYLLTGLIHCGDCGAALFSRPRNNTRRYLCAGRRPGHQLGIIADPVDELVKEFILRLLTTASEREALLVQAGAGDEGAMGRSLADLGAAQSRLQALDDDFYVRGVLGEGRYRSIRVKLEREIDRLRGLVDAGTKQCIVLHPDPRAFWMEADFGQRRDLVRLMIRRVEVMPGRSAFRRFDASRVRLQVAPLQPRTLLGSVPEDECATRRGAPAGGRGHGAVRSAESGGSRGNPNDCRFNSRLGQKHAGRHCGASSLTWPAPPSLGRSTGSGSDVPRGPPPAW